ncbi:MAG: hypothetical protein MJ153_03390 [Clostridia bacterium]|nr:hypothetical protein [Clostridia bacterium]
MAERELRKLNRNELLDVVYEYQQTEKKLRERIALLEEELSNKEIKAKECGSIAKEAMELNGIFEAAQKAADQYVEAVKQAQVAKGEEITRLAEEEARTIIEDAVKHSEAIIKRAEEQTLKLNRTLEEALLQFSREKPTI